MNRRWARILCGLIVFGIAGVARAEYEESPDVQGRIRKLGRGLANIATCPAELVRTPELVSRREGFLAGVTVGVLQGAWRGLARGAAGIYEVLTFYSDKPNGYQPLIRPEFVWEHGHWVE
ncbi:MAG: exosortase system-associated protein, TIGR04073 family [Candidatus Omnitrophica bacterium]|nr:exosortase system-associated protein, TIGR04073 family [Candidatus Omnitrophota bacterium]